MATDSIVGGLFGMNPEMYQQQQNQQALRQAAELAQLDPMARARTGIMYGANRLVGALGGQDPQLQKISAIQSLGQQFDVTTPEGLMQAAGAIRNQYPDVAFGLSQKAQELGLARAKTQKETLSIQQEEKLRSELAGLGPNATQADVLRTVTKYGSPDKILAVLESSSRAADANASRLEGIKSANDAKIEAAKIAADSRIETARMNGATSLQIAQMKADSSAMIAQMRNDVALSTLDLKKQLFANQPLKPALQKEQDNDFKLIDNLKAQVDSLEPVIQTLQINPQTGKAPIELGPINNKRYELANATGNSTPESRAYANLERAIQNATNLKTDAAKGVQTDKDVLRFANELIAAYGKNDTKTTLESLNNFVNSAKKAQVNTLDGIERRRFSQGISAYGGGASAPKNDNSDPLGIRK
tara:strand:- start:2355 stop:3602 length:1248 start_codon:yes stop_codon:yes gene_type:complete